MKRWVDRINGILARRGAGWGLLAALAAVYTIAYATHELNPGLGAGATGRGWWTWADQQQYLKQAEAMAHGRIDAQTYFYPLGYSALAAPFVRWLPAHAFFVPDLGLVLVAAAFWWKLARRWLSQLGALGCAAVFIATHRWVLADTLVVPWNTLVTLCTLSAGIFLVTTRRDARVVWALAGLTAATYLARPVDAAAFAPLLALSVARLSGWRERISHGVGAMLVVVATWAAVGGLNVAVFGTWQSPYEWMSLQASGFFGYPMSLKWFWLFLDGLPFFGEAEPALLWRYPWLLLAAPAAIGWVRREAAAGVAGLAAVLVSATTYVNYNDLLPSDLYRFTLIHYLVWWFPLGFVLVVAACRNGWRDRWVRGGFVAAAVLAVVCAGLRLEPEMRPRGRDGDEWRLAAERPVMLKLEGVSKDAVKHLRLDGRALLEPADYVAPYVGDEFCVMLGFKAKGSVLTLSEETKRPVRLRSGEWRWSWRMSGDRVAKILRRIFWHAWR